MNRGKFWAQTARLTVIFEFVRPMNGIVQDVAAFKILQLILYFDLVDVKLLCINNA